MDLLTTPGLGTQLRHLIELLDGGLEDVYRASGLEYRPRFTPIVKALEETEHLTIKSIAKIAGISHSAASQTITKMLGLGLLESSAGQDGREKLIRLSPKCRSILPSLHAQWTATQMAADSLDAELSMPLSQIAAEAISALTERSFSQRISQAQEHKATPKT